MVRKSIYKRRRKARIIRQPKLNHCKLVLASVSTYTVDAALTRNTGY